MLDDYSSLRSVSEEQLAEEATLFPTRKAWWYHPRFLLDSGKSGSMGASHYFAPNPDFGAMFTYHLRDGLKSKEQIRQASEKARLDTGEDITFPGWDAVADEMAEPDPRIWIVVKDSEGNTVRRVNGPIAKGFNRVAWDLRHPAPESLRLDQPSSSSGAAPSGLLAAPGDYTATLIKEVDGEITTLSLPIRFEVVPLRKRALAGSSPAEAAAFWRSYEVSVRSSTALSQSLRTELARVDAMQKALSRATVAPGDLDQRLNMLKKLLQAFEDELYGNRAKQQVGEMTGPTIRSRLNFVSLGVYKSTYGPTDTLKRTLEIANAQILEIKTELKKARADAATLAKDLMQAGAP